MKEFEYLYPIDKVIRESKKEKYDSKKDLTKVLFANLAGFSLAILLQKLNGKSFDINQLSKIALSYAMACIAIDNNFMNKYRKKFYRNKKTIDLIVEDIIDNLGNLGIHVRKEDLEKGIQKQSGDNKLYFFFDMFDKIRVLNEQSTHPNSSNNVKYRSVRLKIEEPKLNQLGIIKTQKDGTSKLIDKENISEGDFITTYYELSTGKNKFTFYVNNDDIKIINIDGFTQDTNELNNYLMLGIVLQDIGLDTS